MNNAAPVDLEIRVTTPWSSGERLLQYVLHSPTGAVDFHYRTIRGEPLSSPEAFQAALFEQVEKLHRGLDVEGEEILLEEARRELEAIGRDLYVRLFPPEMRAAYRRFRGVVKTLLITSDEPWIPWELLKPYEDRDDDFFCMQFEMSRWLAGGKAPAQGKRVAGLACIEVGEAKKWASLPSAEQERWFLEGLAEEIPGVEGVIVSREEATFDRVEGLLSEGGLDLLHFVGHGDWAAAQPDESKIELADRPLRARHLTGPLEARLAKDRPLVFFNACRVGQQGWSLTGLGGWADRWVRRCGCSAFLAPLWTVADGRALEFAKVVYGELRECKTLSEAVQGARRQLREDQPDDLTWLAYSLYAHPNARVFFGDEALPEVVSGGESQAEAATVAAASEPVLMIPEHRWRPDRSPPGALLRAEYGVVPFHFRRDELEDLDAWCRDGAAVKARLYTGAGGMGKTRLALEICKRLRGEGWRAGLVDASRSPEEIWRALEERGGPRILVVDYAETRRDLLIPLLRRIYRTEGGPIRLLLLARAALDWWEQLKSEGEGVGELLAGPATSRYSLQALAFSPTERAESYRIAVDAFAEKLERSPSEGPPEDLEAEHFERALLLHMSALAAVEGVEVKGEDGILDYVLDREHRFWRRQAVERGLSKQLVTGIGRAMGAITLGGGVEGESQGVEVLRGLKFFDGQKRDVLVDVARLLRACYPGDPGNRWIDPVMPDLLGEHLIQREMEKGADELLDLVLGARESE